MAPMKLRTVLFSVGLLAVAAACNSEPKDTDEPFDGGVDDDAGLGDVTADSVSDGGGDPTDAGQDTVQRDTGGDDAGTDTGGTDAGSGDTADATPDTTPDVAPDVEEDTGPPARCGDGILSGSELCDGDQFPPAIDCTAFDYLGGELGCTDTCTFDTTDCYDSRCGDGIITGDEQCEAEETSVCGDLGFAPGGDEGELTCLDDCTYDTTVCSEAICGNGVPEGDEECDGDIAETCEDLGFAPGGEGAPVCTECGIDTSACQESICDNGVIEEEFEVCDGENVGGDTCRSLGFFSGDILCVDDCTTIDTSGCVPNVCGSATIEGDEVCDDGAIPLTCADLGEEDGGPFVGGTLGCADDCFGYDTTGCVADEGSLGDDADEDGVPDDVDNCPDDPNRLQLDVDLDGIGNVCDDALVFDVLVETETGNVLSAAVAGDLPITVPSVDLPVEAGRVELAFDDAGGVSMRLVSITLEDTAVPLDLGGGGIPLPIPVEFEISFTDGSVTGVDEDAVVLETTLEQVLGGAFDVANPTFAVDSAVSVDTGFLGAAELAAEAEPVSVSSTAWDALEDTVTVTFDDPELTLGEASIGLPPLLEFTLGLEGVTGTLELGLATE